MTDCFIFPKHAYEYTLKTSTECSIDIKKWKTTIWTCNYNFIH